MRGVIGLAGVLAGLVVLVIMMRYAIDHTEMVVSPRHTARIASLNGGKNKPLTFQDSATFVAVDDADGEFHGLKVTAVVKGGVADTHFGLLPGDLITGIGPFEMGDSTLYDFDSAREWVAEAYRRRNVALLVDRNGEELSLPIGGDNSDMTVVASGGADGSSDPSDKSPQITNPGGDE